MKKFNNTMEINKKFLVELLWKTFKSKHEEDVRYVGDTAIQEISAWFYLEVGLGDNQRPQFPKEELRYKPYNYLEHYIAESYITMKVEGMYLIKLQEAHGVDSIKIYNNDKKLLVEFLYCNGEQTASPFTDEKALLIQRILLQAEKAEQPKEWEWRNLEYYKNNLWLAEV